MNTVSAAEHPLIKALFDYLPETNAVFPGSARIAWLDAARAIFILVYGQPEPVRFPIPSSGMTPQS